MTFSFTRGHQRLAFIPTVLEILKTKFTILKTEKIFDKRPTGKSYGKGFFFPVRVICDVLTRSQSDKEKTHVRGKPQHTQRTKPFKGLLCPSSIWPLCPPDRALKRYGWTY